MDTRDQLHRAPNPVYFIFLYLESTHPDIAPIGTRRQLGPISRKGNAPGIGRATVETLELGPLLNIPQSNRTVQTDRGDTIIVRGNADNAQIVAFF